MISNADSKICTKQKYGVLNAYLRLMMYSDGNVKFDIDSKPEGGTDIVFRLPLVYGKINDKEETSDD